MTEQEIIEKASKALKALNLYRQDYITISVAKSEDSILQDYEPELKDKYSVIFTYKQPDGRQANTCVDVDRKTNNLLKVITKNNVYEIPFDLV